MLTKSFTKFPIGFFKDSTSKETFNAELLPVIYQQLESSRNNTGQVSQVYLPGGLLADGKCNPLKIEFLDSVTVHVRMKYVCLL